MFQENLFSSNEINRFFFFFFALHFFANDLYTGSISLASRLNGYMYSNGTSLNLALFILMANHLFVCRITL